MANTNEWHKLDALKSARGFMQRAFNRDNADQKVKDIQEQIHNLIMEIEGPEWKLDDKKTWD